MNGESYEFHIVKTDPTRIVVNAIHEASYLTTGNTPQYRQIMRIFFREYEKMHFQMYKEDVLSLLHGQQGFENYSMEQLKLDLNQLVEWKNLTPIQDPKRVYTIADYKNKQFRYSMSERAVEIERMTVKLETLFIEGGNLSSSYFIRIQQALEQVERMRTASSRERNEWWHNLQDDFKRLNQNYQDYLREFYTGRSDRILKSVEFLLHKDRFITYLQEFIQQLRGNTIRIERLLREIDADEERELLEKVIAGELEIPHAASEKNEPMEQYIRENIHGKWDALKGWFLPTGADGQSESSRVLDITDEIIRKIIQNAALIVQLQNWGISRKEDYRKFITLFQNCADVEEAHKLAAHLFGIQHIRHFKVNGDRSTDSINSSVYEEEPAAYALKPRTRNYRPRMDKTGFEDRSMEKLVQRNRYLERVEKERRMVMHFIRDGRLDISDIEETISSAMRETLLRWIAVANLTKSKTGRTEFGQGYQLHRMEGSCVLHCEDGDLTMPAYIFDFTEEQNEDSTNSAGTVLDQ